MQIKDIKHRLFRQEKVGSWLGGIRAIVTYSSSYAQYINMLASISVFYYTTLTPLSNQFGIEIYVWQFALGLIVVIGTLVIFDWKFTIPSAVRFTNEQQAKHPNPMYDDIKLIKQQNEVIMKHFGLKLE